MPIIELSETYTIADVSGGSTNLAMGDAFVERIVLSQWEKHRRLSNLSLKRRTRIEACRISKLALVSLGAVAQVAATQVPAEYKATTSFIGGICVGLGAYIKKTFLTDELLGEMVQTLHRSQALKSEVFKFRAQVHPYNNFKTNPDETLQLLQDKCHKIAESSYDEQYFITKPDNKPAPGPLLTTEDYIATRMETMKTNFFLARARSKRRRGHLCERMENALLAVGTITGLSASQQFPAGIQKPLTTLSGWGGAFTTISAAVANHIAKEKFNDVAREYTLAASKLDELEESWPREVRGPGSPGWDEQVSKCEDIILSTLDDWVKIATGKEESVKVPAVSKFSEKMWNSKAVCGTDETGHYLASERVDWLVANQSIAEDEARKKVMAEFPMSFKSV